jgi:FkbM family methyltransferase
MEGNAVSPAPVWRRVTFIVASTTDTRDARQKNLRMKYILRTFWRLFLRFRRLWRIAGKFGLIGFARFALIDLVLNPVAHLLKIRNRRVRITVRGYSGAFVLRLATTDAECFLEVILEEEYETAIHLARQQPELVFDAGSNVGYSLRYFQRAFPSAVIIGVEPDAENISLCRENVSRGENPERVRLFACCVAARPATVQLDRTAGAWAIRMKSACQADSGRPIAARTVDQLLVEADAGGRCVDLFKCDIEGAESELFRDPGAWLERSTCLAVETHAPYYDVCLMDDLRRFSNDFEFFPENEMVFARRSTPTGLITGL